MELTILKAKGRVVTTKGALNEIRRQGGVPAVVYGNGMEPVAIEISALDFRGVWGPGRRNELLNIEVDGKAFEVIVYDVQKDAISGQVLHVDFKIIKSDEKVKVFVPVRLVGTAVGVKSEGGQLFQLTKRVRLACLPSNIPSFLEVDVTPYHSEHVFYVRDIELNGHELVSSSKAVLFYIQKGRKK